MSFGVRAICRSDRGPGPDAAFRHAFPVLRTVPVTSMLDETKDSREARPIRWDEQRRLLPALPVHLARMTLFCLNTGLQDKPLRNLRWSWEGRRKLDDIEVSVFEVPKEFVKDGRRVGYVVCNSVAQSIVDSVRRQHPEFVFVYQHNQYRRSAVSKGTARKAYAPKTPTPLTTGMSNTGWAAACREAGLDGLHVHDLRHTVGMRLREAGVSEETRADCLWQVRQGMPQHYAVAQVREIYDALELIKDETNRSNVSLRMLSLESRRQAPKMEAEGILKGQNSLHGSGAEALEAPTTATKSRGKRVVDAKKVPSGSLQQGIAIGIEADHR